MVKDVFTFFFNGDKDLKTISRKIFEKIFLKKQWR